MQSVPDIQSRSSLGIVAGARLALGLLPGASRRVALLTTLGIATSIVDTLAIGVVILVLQFALETSQTVEGYGALGFVVNFAQGLAQQNVWVVGSVVFCILVAQSLLSASYEGLTSHLRLQAYQTFREQVFANWISRDLHGMDQKNPGAMVNTIQNETWEAADAVFHFCTIVIAAAIAAVYFLVMAATSLTLTAVAVVLGFVATALIARVRQSLWRHSQLSIDQKEALARHFVGNLHALRTIKAFRAEKATVQRSNRLSLTLRRTFESIVRLETAIKPIAGIVSAAILGTVFLVAWKLDIPGTVILGFVIVLYRAQPRVQTVFQTLGKFSKTLPSVVNVAEQLEPVARSGDDGDMVFNTFQHEIRCEDVTYSYPGSSQPVINGLAFSLRKGEMTAVLGRSGAGKSTMINLLLRFAAPGDGAITCDGTPISAFTRSSWLSRVAVAGQDVELIDGTIRENVLLGRPSATDDEVWQALEVASVADVVRGLPAGLDAEVGPRGVSLSGGQRQRLCLARALLVDTELLILDEATNAVDSIMEQAIYARIREAYPHLTMLVVAHRTSIGQLADQVIVMADGRVVERGSPEALLERRGGVFASLCGQPADDSGEVRFAT